MKKLLLLFILSLYYTTVLAKPNQAMVVTAQHLATQVGVKVLQQGGNAVDAAVAIGYALAVVHPCCGNIGGGGFMLIHLANGQNHVINFREKAPHLISQKLFLDDTGNVVRTRLTGGHLQGQLSQKYLAIGVPGTVMGLNTALAEYGTLSLKKVLAPAIHLAEKGYRLQNQDAKILSYGEKSFATQKNIAAIFLKRNQSLKPGDLLVQKNLAHTLTLIADKGSRGFYRGEIAKKIAIAAEKNGGVLTKADFANYSVEETKPIHCNYRGYQIITVPPPSSGVTLCEILNIVKGYPLKRWGYRSVKSLQANIEAMRLAYFDRNRYLGDPVFVKMPIKKLVSEKYAQSLRKKITFTQAGNSKALGSVTVQPEGHNTTAYAVVDNKGNAVVVIYTINNYFGAKVMATDTGFFLNNELDDFSIKSGTTNSFGLIHGWPNQIAPNKRPLSSMTPVMVFHKGQLFMVLGTPGGSTIVTQLVQVIENVIDYGMHLQAAVDAPRYHFQWLPDKIFYEQGAFTEVVQSALKRLGYHLQQGSPWSSKNWGAVAAIERAPKTGQWIGAIDSRRSSGLAQGH